MTYFGKLNTKNMSRCFRKFSRYAISCRKFFCNFRRSSSISPSGKISNEIYEERLDSISLFNINTDEIDRKKKENEDYNSNKMKIELKKKRRKNVKLLIPDYSFKGSDLEKFLQYKISPHEPVSLPKSPAGTPPAIAYSESFDGLMIIHELEEKE